MNRRNTRDAAQWEANLLALVIQCIYIELTDGGGEEAAREWAENTLDKGNNFPSETPEWRGQTAQQWFDEHYQAAS